MNVDERNRSEDFNKAKVLATQAAKSGAYLYPIKVRLPSIASLI